MGNHSIKSAVKERRWKEVETLLKRRHYIRKDIDEFITSCEAANNFSVSEDIVTHFRSGQLNRFVYAAIQNDQWQAAGRMLRFFKDRRKRSWVINEARKRLDDDDFDSYILPHCSDTEQDLRHAVQKGHWKSVLYILATRPRCALDRWAVEEASKKADRWYFEKYLLPHCSDNHIESVLQHLVTRGLWLSVGNVLERGVSDEKRRWAVHEASIRSFDYQFERYILPHCGDDQLESVLEHLVKRYMWGSVGKVLERGVSDTQRRWAVQEACTQGLPTDLGFERYILPHCSDDQLESVLKDLITRRMWRSVGKVLERGVGETLYRWAVEEASERANDRDFELYILPHCNDDQLEVVLIQLVTRCMWRSTGTVLGRGVRDTLNRWAVEEASKRANDSDFELYILPHCNDDQLEVVLKHLVTRCRPMWQSVGKVLERGVRDTLYRWAVEEASERATDCDFELYILPHCNDGQLEVVLKQLVTRCMWCSTGKVLGRGVSDTLYRWAVEEASERVGDDDFDSYILPHCSDTEKELRQAVQKGHWASVGDILVTGVRCPLDRWAVEEASKRAYGWYFEKYILPYCHTDDQLECVLKHLVERGMWLSVGNVLERGVSDTQRRWAVQEASIGSVDYHFERYILPHCGDDQLESVLQHLVKRCMWESVGKVFERGVGEKQRSWAVQEACKQELPTDLDFERYILPHCSDDQLQSVLTHLITRRMWRSVGKVLGRGVRDTLYRWAVEEASEIANDSDFELYILPHCNDGQLEVVLEHLVSRCMWRSTCKVLEIGVSEEARKRVVNDEDFDSYILPHCSDTEQKLRQAVQKGHWTVVGEILASGVRCALNRWAVEEASKRTDGFYFERFVLTGCKTVDEASERANDIDFERYILPHCNDGQLDSILKHLVTRGMWESVGKVLERGVSDTHRRWAVQEACEQERPTDLDFDRCILPHCSDDQLESVLKHLITRCMWRSVGKVLGRGVSDTLCRWAVQEMSLCFIGPIQISDSDSEASEIVNDRDFEHYILPHFNDGQLDVALKPLVTRCMWQCVGHVLQRGVSDTQHRWAVEEASKRAQDWAFTQYIIPHCNDDQLKSVLKHLVTQGLFASITMITQRGKTLHTLLLSEMCRLYSYTDVMKNIEMLGQPSMKLLISCLRSGQLATNAKSVALRFTLHQNKWAVIRKVSLSHVWEQVRRELFRAAVEQRRWSFVKKWADHTVYDNQRWWAQEEAYKEKQWDVMLLLTDYGMTDIELMRVRYRLAKYADWDVVVRMSERGVDVTEVREVVESAMISRKTARDEAKRRALVARWHQLRQLEDYYTKALSGRARKWSLVLFYFHRHHRHHPSLQQLLQRAIKDEAWHLVRHLLRLGLDTAQQDSLLTEMISRHQWGVCRVLLEQGVGVQSCLKVLPVLMDSDQWTLVARVMEYNVGDDCRQRVMRRAMEMREGSVVWRCIRTMQHYRLSVEERETLFQLAMSGGVWEVVKPLMEELDSTGLRHRDTALLEAIEQHQWDVVDYCQLHKADINMKDDQGQTPLNRAGTNKDWKAVKELVIRGGDPNAPDIDRHCILNIVIHADKWYLTRLIIEYHGHIHVVDDFGSTPLQFLIDKRKGEIIHHTLMWCPNQSKVVNWKGETTLHAIALDKRPELMYSQIVRGVNPLTLTQDGHSVLLYAVQNPHSAQRMVAECIKLGFGTHQPQFNDQMTVGQLYQNVLCIILHREKTRPAPRRPTLWRPYTPWEATPLESTPSGHTPWEPTPWRPTPAPLLWAVVHGNHVVAHMLYESGSCSYTQLLQLYAHLNEISDPFSEHGRSLLEDISRQLVEEQEKCRVRYDVLMKRITTFLPYLREMATTPRSLVSTCRLVISHHLIVRGRRERDVQQLPLTDKMKNYVLFSDLADPDYAWYLHGILPPVPEES